MNWLLREGQHSSIYTQVLYDNKQGAFCSFFYQIESLKKIKAALRLLSSTESGKSIHLDELIDTGDLEARKVE